MTRITEEKIDFLRSLILTIEYHLPFAKFEGRTNNEKGKRNGIMIRMFDDLWYFIIPEFSNNDLFFFLSDLGPRHFSKLYKGLPNLKNIGDQMDIGDASIFVEVINPSIEEISDYFYTYYFES